MDPYQCNMRIAESGKDGGPTADPSAATIRGPDIQAWMTLAAAAAYLACNERTLRRWVRRGDITAHRFGRQLRFRQADLDQTLMPAADETTGHLDAFITNSIKPAPRAP